MLVPDPVVGGLGCPGAAAGRRGGERGDAQSGRAHRDERHVLPRGDGTGRSGLERGHHVFVVRDPLLQTTGAAAYPYRSARVREGVAGQRTRLGGEGEVLLRVGCERVVPRSGGVHRQVREGGRPRVPLVGFADAQGVGQGPVVDADRSAPPRAYAGALRQSQRDPVPAAPGPLDLGEGPSARGPQPRAVDGEARSRPRGTGRTFRSRWRSSGTRPGCACPSRSAARTGRARGSPGPH